MDDLSEQLAARDRLMRQVRARRTPAERVREMMRLQQQAWDRLRSSPAGYAHFIRRNFRARAVPVPPDGGTHAR